jgi:hypothetical protein
MNTQNLLHDRSSEIPEGLYLELMNKLKIDFDQKQQSEGNKTKVVILNRSIPCTIARSKQELIVDIVKKSVDWVDREEILLKVSNKRVMFCEVKDWCPYENVLLNSTTHIVDFMWINNCRIVVRSKLKFPRLDK